MSAPEPSWETRPAVLLLVGERMEGASFVERLRDDGAIQVVAVPDLRAARAALRSRPVDAVLLVDDGDGQESLRWAEELHRIRRDVPVALAVGSFDPKFVQRVVNERQIARLLLRPVDEREAVAVLSELLRSRRGSMGRIPPR